MPNTREPAVPRPFRANRKVRILIVDDHPMMRAGLANAVEQERDMEVCAQTSNGTEALAVLAASKPDLILTDLTLPEMSGLELIRAIHVREPELPILVVSMHEEALYAERALRAGARGYISKEDASGKLIQAMRKVLRGEMYVNEKTQARILKSFSGCASPVDQTNVGQLSDREFGVLQLIGQGLPTRGIAERLKISAKTVETHRVNIKRKLGLGTINELSVYAAKMTQTDLGRERGGS